MKKMLVFMFALMILISVTACDAGSTEQTTPGQSSTATPEKATEPEVVPTQTQPAETEPTIPTEPEETEYPVPPETLPGETEPADTEPEETEPEATEKFPYTEYVAFADQPIYSGPGYDYDYVGPVGIATNYTILEECEDSDGNIWGKLKSGVGWIDLTNARYAAGHREENPPLLVGLQVADSTWADDYFIHDETEYAVRIAFIAGADLYYRFYEGDISEFLQPGECLTMGSLEKDQTLIAQIAFPGDLTTYLMEVETHKDVVVWYQIYQSMEDGRIICEELKELSE